MHMKRLTGIASIVLFITAAASASTGLEYPLTAPSASRFLPAVAYDGAAFGVVWAAVDPSQQSRISYARVNDVNEIRTAPVLLAQTSGALTPAIASDGRVTLITWLEPGSPCSVRGSWVAGDGRPGSPFTIATIAGCTSIDTTSAGDRFLVTVAGSSAIRAWELAPLSTVTTREGLLAQRSASEVRIAYANGRLLVASVEGQALHARLFDDAFNTAGIEVTRERAADIEAIASGDEFIVGFGRPSQQGVTLLRLDRNGAVAGERFDYFPSRVALVRRAVEIFSGWNGAGDVFFNPMAVDLNPSRRFDPQQAYSVSATPRTEADLAWAAAARAILAVYSSTGDAGTSLVFRVIDPVTMIRPPYTPTGLTVTAVDDDRIEVRWDKHVEATSLRLMFTPQGQAPFSLPDAVFAGDATSGVVTLHASAPSYEIRLIAQSEQGISAPSAPVTVTTHVQLPGKKRAGRK